MAEENIDKTEEQNNVETKKTGIESFGVPGAAVSEPISEEEKKERVKKFRDKIKKKSARGSFIASIAIAIFLIGLAFLQYNVIAAVAGGSYFVGMILTVMLGVIGGTIIISVLLIAYLAVSIVFVLNKRSWIGLFVFVVQIAYGVFIFMFMLNNLSMAG